MMPAPEWIQFRDARWRAESVPCPICRAQPHNMCACRVPGELIGAVHVERLVDALTRPQEPRRAVSRWRRADKAWRTGREKREAVEWHRAQATRAIHEAALAAEREAVRADVD